MVMQEVFSKILQQKLTPNGVYVLFCIKEKIKCSDSINFNLEVLKLKSGNYLINDLEISGNTLKFMEEIEGYFKKSKKKTSKTLMGDEFLENIKTYNECFPATKLPSGVYARVNVKSLENAFRWFFQEFNYSWETVIQATEKYVEEYSINRYNYMRNSQYFVRKQNTDKTWDSNLATYCDMISQDDYEAPVFFKEKIV
jgi:hypothetical protein